jgi:hypothetical protein
MHSEQHDRDRPQQMRASPPGQSGFREVLRPREQQQQAEHDLDVHRHHEKRVDVQTHEFPTAYRLSRQRYAWQRNKR